MINPLRLNPLALVSVIVFALSACSGVQEKRLEYRQSQSILPLQVPVDLQVPQSREMLPLHPVNPETVEVDVKPPINLPPELLGAAKSSKKTDVGTELSDED